MAEMTTKQRIASEALTLFSSQGYDAVSVRDISRAVGIKESSLYNHFRNKQDIFDSIVEECAKLANNFFKSVSFAGAFDEAVDSATKRDSLDDEEFLSISIGIFQFFFQDETLVKFRRMLTIEQFNNERIKSLMCEVFVENTLRFLEGIFQSFIRLGIFIKADPYLLAMEFYGPVFMMFYQFDELSDEASDLLIRHIIQFKELHTVDK